MKVKINDKIVKGDALAYDGCHKIYILQDEKDKTDAKEYGYTIYGLDMIKEIYEESCPLRFIENWKLDGTCYAKQYESANIEFLKEV